MMTIDPTLAAAISALATWYMEWGVETATTDTPADWYAVTAAARERLLRDWPGAAEDSSVSRGGPAPVLGGKVTAPAVPRTDPAAVDPLSPEEAAALARSRAVAAQSLAELEQAIRAFEGCALKATASNTVFADGNPDADLMLVGEAPGAEEDRRGLPFVGQSGRLLDRMLRAIGRDRSTVYITNVLPWRPPGNRTPTPAEIATCLPFTLRHIALVRPKLVVAVGGVSAKALLDRPEGITRLRGRSAILDLPELAGPLPVFANFHPAYLLRQPAQKRLAWNDWLRIEEMLEKQSSPVS